MCFWSIYIAGHDFDRGNQGVKVFPGHLGFFTIWNPSETTSAEGMGPLLTPVTTSHEILVVWKTIYNISCMCFEIRGWISNDITIYIYVCIYVILYMVDSYYM